jgi:hypothetical protein
MDSSWARIIAAAQAGDTNTLIDGDRSNFRLVKQRFKNACSMHLYAERVRAGSLTRPGDTDTDPTRAEYDDVNRKVYSCTVMLLTEVLANLHDPANDADVTDGDGCSLWTRLEAVYGDATVTEQETDVISNRISMTPKIEDKGHRPSKILAVLMSANQRNGNGHNLATMRQLFYRILPPCLETDVKLMRQRQPALNPIQIIQQVKSDEASYKWHDVLFTFEDICPAISDVPAMDTYRNMGMVASEAIGFCKNCNCSACRELKPKPGMANIAAALKEPGPHFHWQQQVDDAFNC